MSSQKSSSECPLLVDYEAHDLLNFHGTLKALLVHYGTHDPLKFDVTVNAIEGGLCSILQHIKKVEAEKAVLISQVEKLEAEKSDLVYEVDKLKSEKFLLITTHAEEKLSLEDKVKKLEAEKSDLVSEVERLKSEKSLLTTTYAEEKLSLEDKVSSLETLVADKVAFFKDLDTDNTEKYKKYEADYVRRIEAKYFSKKNLYGGNIFENETTIENEVIKSSRWPSTRSYTDPVQSFEDHSRSSSTSAAETSANLD